METKKFNVKEFLLNYFNSNGEDENYFFISDGALLPIEEIFLAGRQVTLRNITYDESLDLSFNDKESIIYQIQI